MLLGGKITLYRHFVIYAKEGKNGEGDTDISQNQWKNYSISGQDGNSSKFNSTPEVKEYQEKE
jgi:hypothetical protein